ncbi:hypothetical protein R5W24_004636 [Gemmata sp. JC717]|uniref:hypothetical protein n=1 Tax=Gemmata algarum TaxID=2975278 RepID=UPI0021BB879E|nr:hypothetical protein [Gemmata algarum]MDY3555493.1 hypothetical protein [Gemmata algarum]
MAGTVNGGTYMVPGVPYGPCRVTVTPLQAEPEVTSGPGGPRKPGQEDPAPRVKAGPAPKKPAGPPIPEKFKSVDTSGLATKVDQEKVTFAISLD